MTIIALLGLLAVVWTVGLLVAIALCVSAGASDASRPAPPVHYEQTG